MKASARPPPRFGTSNIILAAALGAFLLLEASTAHAQVLQAFDDAFGIPSDQWLVVDVPGILDNDLLDGESAGESGATAVLVSDVSPWDVEPDIRRSIHLLAGTDLRRKRSIRLQRGLRGGHLAGNRYANGLRGRSYALPLLE